jgi:predicted Rossmann fold flavoprotein
MPISAHPYAHMSTSETVDVVVIGAGAAGLMTAISTARHGSTGRVVCLDGARTLGAKILVSGGARCNVTNRVVTERDFWGGPPRVVRDVLKAFPAETTAAFFREIGVALHEEEHGKLFPDSHRARTVLDALLGECARLGVDVRAACRVTALRRDGAAFDVETSTGVMRAAVVVLATGGRSLPKSGSDGFGYSLASACGHSLIDTTPALVPLLLRNEDLRALSGVSQPAEMSVRVEGHRPVRIEGSLLWTHFGASGPVVLNASRHWHRAILEGRPVAVTINICPGHTFESLEAWWVDFARARPRATVLKVLTTLVPAAVADLWLKRAGVDPALTMAHVSREDRRAMIRALLETTLDVRDSRGYTYAEVTAGGVPLTEIDPRTMASRVCSGLYLVGEILDVDGRIGGFNFQWAWSSGWVAGRAIATAADIKRTEPPQAPS